jgi:NAD(P)-dependent dehydrogenase (short-subunit alcohol dehydrogenase family)
VLRFESKHVAVIGGTSGMGLAAARLMEDEGASVLVTGRTSANVEAARQQLGGDAIVLQSDVSSLREIDALAQKIQERLGELDALFLSAGISRNTSIQNTSQEIYDEVFEINTKGTYFTLQRLAPLMRRGGGIVLATSVSNVKGLPNNSAYAASKAAVRSMARTFARELLPQGVRVNAVSPGPIDTGILDRSMPAQAAEALTAQMTANNPMGRFGTPDEIARAVAFLAFDATFTTGAELAVDGGVSQLV